MNPTPLRLLGSYDLEAARHQRAVRERETWEQDETNRARSLAYVERFLVPGDDGKPLAEQIPAGVELSPGVTVPDPVRWLNLHRDTLRRPLRQGTRVDTKKAVGRVVAFSMALHRINPELAGLKNPPASPSNV